MWFLPQIILDSVRFQEFLMYSLNQQFINYCQISQVCIADPHTTHYSLV